MVFFKQSVNWPRVFGRVGSRTGLGATTGVTPSHARNYRVSQTFPNSFGTISAHDLLIPLGMKNIFFSKNFPINLKIKGKHTDRSKTRNFAKSMAF